MTVTAGERDTYKKNGETPQRKEKVSITILHSDDVSRKQLQAGLTVLTSV